MAGIYIHIPFCKQACYYCDFHFSTNLQLKEEVVKSICHELFLQKEYLGNEKIETIYLGGGTPSLLDQKELEKILESIQHHFSIESSPEITLEANPDDLTNEKITILSKIGINRLSIGVQSFHPAHLIYLHRSHTTDQAEKCIRIAQEKGILNISVDLIYAIPHPTHAILQEDLEKMISLDPFHISTYCLTIEPKTVFGNLLKKGNMDPIEEGFAAEQYELVMNTLEKNGYEQYEISNFSKPGHESKHNSNYWKQKKYVGIGPSAHSYNGVSRQYTISNNSAYVNSIKKNIIPFEIEILTKENQINEYVLTSLRTKWGCNFEYIKQKYEVDFFSLHSIYLTNLIKNNLCVYTHSILFLTQKGKLVADQIASDLFMD